jgi:divalent metal cation (Fe/Co/Zn/Cd) transporter
MLFIYARVRLPTSRRVERVATLAIGTLLVMLAVAALGTSIASLVAHDQPSRSNASLIISACATFIMFLFWVPKRYLAKALNSSTMNGEALCTLSCIQFSGALLIGSLIYRVWRGGWWVDSATAIAIAVLFGWEGYKMIRWASNDRFDGGCSCGKEERKVIPEVMQQPSTAPQRCCSESGCCKPSQEGSSKVE